MIKKFDNFEEAFSYCREKNYPVLIIIDGKKYKLYPSGRVEEKS